MTPQGAGYQPSEQMNILENARPENRFYCVDGTVLRNVQELAKKLKTISVQAFRHHASETRNDFHNWIKDVYHDNELANELLRAKMPFEAAAIVRRHVSKALKSRQEIENAIEKAKKATIRAIGPARAKNRLKTKAKAKPSKKARAKRKQKPGQKILAAKTKKPRTKPASKNRKVIKKRRRKRTSGKTKSSMTFFGTRPKGNKKRRQAKKQVKGWLNWLKVIPEL